MPPVADILTSPTEVDEGVRFASSGVAIGSGPDDPSLSGVVAAVGDYWYRTNGEIWRKTGAGDTAWTQWHPALDQLVHSIAETSYEKLTYSGSKVTNRTYWTDSGMTVKIREYAYTYSGQKIATETITQYDGAGSAVLTLTGTYTYSGAAIDNIDWVIT